MKKQIGLSIITAGILAFTSLANAAHHSYKGEGAHRTYHDYKGEVAKRTYRNYKDEQMMPMPEPCGTDQDLLDGFYVGVQGGYDNYRIRQSVTDGSGDSFNSKISPTGFAGGLFVGFGQYFSDIMYFGAEAFGNWSGASTSWSAITPDENFHSTVKGQGNYGIHLIPGIKLNNYALGYLRVGYNYARFYTSEYGNLGGIGYSAHKGSWKGGWAAGVGIEAAIYQNWSVRGEYTYARYKSLNNSATGASYSPSDGQVLMGVVFHFT